MLSSLARILHPISLNIIKSDYIQLLLLQKNFLERLKKLIAEHERGFQFPVWTRRRKNDLATHSYPMCFIQIYVPFFFFPSKVFDFLSKTL